MLVKGKLMESLTDAVQRTVRCTKSDYQERKTIVFNISEIKKNIDRVVRTDPNPSVQLPKKHFDLFCPSHSCF